MRSDSYCKKLRQRGYDDTRYMAQLHSRLALPFASLVMAFLGVPFALRTGRTSGIAVGIGVSLGIGFCYYAINAVLLSFGQGGVLPPLVSAWSANLIFAGIAVWLCDDTRQVIRRIAASAMIGARMPPLSSAPY